MPGINDEEMEAPFLNFRDGPFRSPGGAGWDPFLTGADYVGPMIDNPVPEGFVAEGVIGPAQIVAGSALADTTPPGPPTGLSLSSEVGQQPDGGLALNLVATLTQPTDSDLFGSYVEVTARESAPGVPDWDRPSLLLIGKTQTKATIPGVPGGTTYYARAYAADQWGNRSTLTGVVSAVTGADTVAPSMPSGVSVIPGFRGLGVSWTPSIASDMSFHELRYARDLAGVPDPNDWVSIRTRANAIFIPGLIPDTLYWVQVRAVDRSGNVVTSASDPTAVNFATNPNSGWTDAQSATPTAIGAADVAFNVATMNLINAGIINADDIKTGSLSVGTALPGAGAISGIVITNGSAAIGWWNDTGLKIVDPANPDHYVLIDAGQVKFTRDDGATFPAAITPDGINASAINFGSAPGGHNLIYNSSFELADFVAAASTFTFTDTTNWAAANRTVAPDNITEGTTLAMTTAGYV